MSEVQERTILFSKLYLILVGVISITLSFIQISNLEWIKLSFHSWIWVGFGVSLFITGLAYLHFSRQFLRDWKLIALPFFIQLFLVGFYYIYTFHEGLNPTETTLFYINCLLLLPVSKIIYNGFEINNHLEEQVNYFYSTRVEKENLETKTSKGVGLLEQSYRKPVMLIFLRHFGCTFCREMLFDLSENIAFINKRGIDVVIVHMSPEPEGMAQLNRYKLSEVAQISDPEQKLYNAFSLEKGSWSQLLGFKVIMRAIIGGVLFKNRQGKIMGDFKQLPGIFLILDGQIIKTYRHYSSADKPDFVQFAETGCLDHPVVLSSVNS